MSLGDSLLLHLAELRPVEAALGDRYGDNIKRDENSPATELADLGKNVFPSNGSIHTAG